MKIILVFLNGDFHAPTFNAQQADFIIAADGGIRHAHALGCRVDLWLGDFDSSSFYNSKYTHMKITEKKRFPENKDMTDWEIVLEEILLRFGEKDVLLAVVGATGEETDHAFANLWVLGNYPFKAIVAGKNQTVIYAPAPFRLAFRAKPDDVFSLIAYEDMRVTASGLKWPMDEKLVERYSAAACRNLVSEGEVQIMATEGRGLMFMPRAAQIMGIE